MTRQILSSLLLLVFGFLSLSCESDNFFIGPNGNPDLRSLEFRDGTLIPPFEKDVLDYKLLIHESEPVWAKYQGYVHATKIFLNGEFCRINTNEYGFPAFTDIKPFITNEILVIESYAADGLRKTYRIRLLGSNHDASLTELNFIGGELYPPEFKERTPPNFLGPDGEIDSWMISTTNDQITAFFVKKETDARLSLNGEALSRSKLENGSVISNIILNGIQTNWLTNISYLGDFTNVKKLIVSYIDPTIDNRVMSCEIYERSGDVIHPLPRFHYSVGDYSLVLDSIDRVNLTVRAANPDCVLRLELESTDRGTQKRVIGHTAKDGDLLFYNDLDLTQGDFLILTSEKGGVRAQYRFRIRAFTRDRYGINGNISQVLRDIQSRKEIPAGSGYAKEIEGIVTFMTDYDENVRAGMFLEDGAYGIYVWTWNGWQAGLKPGMRVKTTVTAGKIYYGVPEVTDCRDTRVLDEFASRPLFYQDGNANNWNDLRQLGRLYRYRADRKNPISTGYSSIGEGVFTPSKAFKIFIPNNKNLAGIRTEAKEYLYRGGLGDFWGPLMSDGHGFFLWLKGKEYMRIPFLTE